MLSHRPPCRTAGSSLPPLYAGWMTDLLPGPIPAESDTTCDCCAMLPDAETVESQASFFLPETKCCTYIPSIPNFLVGRILDEASAERVPARDTVQARLGRRIGVTPLGLEAPPLFSVLYREGKRQAFGRSRRLRCPHLLDGRCGVWAHRNGVCATWFCKHARGAVGNRFWQALDQLLARTERALAAWCLLELGVETTVLHRLFPPGTDRGADGAELDGPQVDGVVPEGAYRALWGRWAGREAALYREAAQRVSEFGWAEVAALSPEVRLYAALVVDRYKELVSRRALPARLRVGTLRILSGHAGLVRVAGYSGLHPLELPADLLAALPYFDGRPVGETLRRIRSELRLDLQPTLVRKLADFEILVAAGDEQPRPRSPVSDGAGARPRHEVTSALRS